VTGLKGPLAVGIAAMAVTLLFWAAAPRTWLVNESNDYDTFYEPAGREIAAGHGFVMPDGGPATRYPPGYPILLGGLFAFSRATGLPEPGVLAAFRVICQGLAAALLYATARAAWGSRAGLVTAAVWMTYPLALWLTKQPNSELPFFVVFFLLVLALLALLRRPSPGLLSALAIGVLAGLGMLIRPFAVGIGIFAAALLFFRAGERGWSGRTRLAVAALVLLGNLIAIAPWEWWVYRHTHELVLLAPRSMGPMRDGLLYGASGHGVPADVAKLSRDLVVRFDREVHSYGDVIKLLAGEMRTRPGAVFGLLLLKSARAWYATDSGRHEIPVLLLQLPYLAAIAWSLRLAWARNRPLVVAVSALALYFWIMAMTALTIVRYLVPALGLLFVLLPALAIRRRETALHVRGREVA